MSVYRIGEVQASTGSEDELREFMVSIMPLIKNSEGCISCHFYQDQDNPSRFIMVELWESAAAHQASIKNIPPEKLDEIRPLLGAPPSGSYFGLVAQL
jgi:heme oxygenase (mycobilin-producing)